MLNRNKKISLVVTALTICLFALGCQQKSPLHNAPNFQLQSIHPSQEEVSLSDWADGGPVLLVFWASWCPSCVEAVPRLKEWHESYQEQGLRILAVNLKEDLDTVQQFIERKGIPYTVVRDEDGSVAASYQVVNLPVSVFLAKGGEILYYGLELPRRLDNLLRQ